MRDQRMPACLHIHRRARSAKRIKRHRRNHSLVGRSAVQRKLAAAEDHTGELIPISAADPKTTAFIDSHRAAGKFEVVVAADIAERRPRISRSLVANDDIAARLLVIESMQTAVFDRDLAAGHIETVYIYRHPPV